MTAIRYIRERLEPASKEFRTYVIRCFKHMDEYTEPQGNILYSCILYVCAKLIGYCPIIVFGKCHISDRVAFYDVWLEIDGHIIDMGLYGNVNFGEVSGYGCRATSPFIGDYDDENIKYDRFIIGDDWKDHYLHAAENMTISEYFDNAPDDLAWHLLFDVLGWEHNRENVERILNLIGNDVIFYDEKHYIDEKS